MLRFLAYLVIVDMSWRGAKAQIDLDDIAKNLDVKYAVISNVNGNDIDFNASVTLTNNGDRVMPKSEWELYFTGLYMIEPSHLYNDAWYDIPGKYIRVQHVNGGLFKFTPTGSFEGLEPGESLVIDLVIQNWSVSKTDSMPNWYISDASNGLAKIIQSTETENLESFTGEFDTEKKWKRFANDRYNPWTPEERWSRNAVQDLGTVPKLSIPTPQNVVSDTDKQKITKPLTGWVVYTESEDLENEVNILFEKLRWKSSETEPKSKYVKLELTGNSSSGDDEGYKLDVNGEKEVITISAPTSTGVYYGIQTLLAILDTKSQLVSDIPTMSIEDSPRYRYRGMHLDVARHFVEYEDVIKLVKAMGMYKLNKLHFHITDDEAWRIEMPWCPYLTKVGGKQCHDLTETHCLLPQFGSKADGTGKGSGFYSAEEYKSILRTAVANHIEVIPEVDMPGHARAAIKATEAYLKAAKMGHFNVTEAEEIQLSDPEDHSKYTSVQLYTDNALNPCLETSYNFVEKVVQTFVDYHKDIQPLKVMHLGGDEVAHGAWKESPACMKLMENNSDLTTASDLSEYFVERISKVVQNVGENLTLGLWEDGAITTGEAPFNISAMATKSVLTYAWQNIWEWGAGSRPYKLANAGYEVVMSQASHTYFDHPYEPDPEERGLYWATRFTNTKKTFGFMPDDLYANVDTKRSGEPYSREELCEETECTQLERRENIIGIQGQIWTETIRTPDAIFSMIFPRLIALAERAWHKGSWERSNSAAEKEKDWVEFANTVGYRELARLDEMDIPYRVPAAGAKVEDEMVHVNSEFPGLEITYSSSREPLKKRKYVTPVPIEDIGYLQVRSSDGARGGRIVSLDGNSRGGAAHNPRGTILPLCVAVCLAVLFLS